MNKNKLYKILYLACVILTVIISLLSLPYVENEFSVLMYSKSILNVINIILTIVFSILLLKNIKMKSLYNILYFIALIFIIIMSLIFSNFLLIHLVTMIILCILLVKNKLESVNILFPIAYLIFFAIVILIMFLFNNKLIISYIHFDYYLNFVLFNYILLNLYSILSIKIEK